MVRYAYYLIQRALERVGGVPRGPGADAARPSPGVVAAVAALAKDAKDGKGARRVLATRALCAASRVGDAVLVSPCSSIVSLWCLTSVDVVLHICRRA